MAKKSRGRRMTARIRRSMKKLSQRVRHMRRSRKGSRTRRAKASRRARKATRSHKVHRKKGTKNKSRRSTKGKSAWLTHVGEVFKEMKKKDPNASYKQALKAKSTSLSYKKKQESKLD